MQIIEAFHLFGCFHRSNVLRGPKDFRGTKPAFQLEEPGTKFGFCMIISDSVGSGSFREEFAGLTIRYW